MFFLLLVCNNSNNTINNNLSSCSSNLNYNFNHGKVNNNTLNCNQVKKKSKRNFNNFYFLKAISLNKRKLFLIIFRIFFCYTVNLEQKLKKIHCKIRKKIKLLKISDKHFIVFFSFFQKFPGSLDGSIPIHIPHHEANQLQEPKYIELTTQQLAQHLPPHSTYSSPPPPPTATTNLTTVAWTMDNQ